MGLIGIDVSRHNGHLDWDYLKSCGVTFALIRVGVGENIEKQDDSEARYNIDECKRLGIPWGAYIYSYGTSDYDGYNEAEHMLRVLDGDIPPLGCWTDQEDSDVNWLRTEHGLDLTDGTVDRIIANFTEEILNNSENIIVGVYANHNWLTNYIDMDYIINQLELPIWEAHYNGDICKCLDGTVIRQVNNNCNGIIDGVGGIDCNVIVDESFERLITAITEEVDDKQDLSLEELVINTLNGAYGDGEERLLNLGTRYNEVQSAINDSYSIAKSIIDMVDNCDYNMSYDILSLVIKKLREE